MGVVPRVEFSILSRLIYVLVQSAPYLLLTPAVAQVSRAHRTFLFITASKHGEPSGCTTPVCTRATSRAASLLKSLKGP